MVDHKGLCVPHPFWTSSGQIQVIVPFTTLVRSGQRQFLQSPGAGAYGLVSCSDEILDVTDTPFLSTVRSRNYGRWPLVLPDSTSCLCHVGLDTASSQDNFCPKSHANAEGGINTGRTERETQAGKVSMKFSTAFSALAIIAGASARRMTVHNNCPFTIW